MLIQLRSDEDRNLIEQGFTLVELLIVIVILGILAAIVVFAVGNLTDSTKSAGCVTEGQSFYTAFQAYKAANKGTSPGLGTDTTASRDQVIADLTNTTYNGQAPAAGASNGPFLQKAPVTASATGGFWDNTDSTNSPTALYTQAKVNANNGFTSPAWIFLPSTGAVLYSDGTSGSMKKCA